MNTIEVDSIKFKNAIIKSQIPFELPEFEKDIEEMIIEPNFGNDYYSNMIIQNYPKLQSIVVNSYSLKNLHSLKICNCKKLKTFKTEEYAFHDIKSMMIESIDYLILLFKSS